MNRLRAAGAGAARRTTATRADSSSHLAHAGAPHAAATTNDRRRRRAPDDDEDDIEGDQAWRYVISSTTSGHRPGRRLLATIPDDEGGARPVARIGARWRFQAYMQENLILMARSVARVSSFTTFHHFCRDARDLARSRAHQAR